MRLFIWLHLKIVFLVITQIMEIHLWAWVTDKMFLKYCMKKWLLQYFWFRVSFRDWVSSLLLNLCEIVTALMNRGRSELCVIGSKDIKTWYHLYLSVSLRNLAFGTRPPYSEEDQVTWWGLCRCIFFPLMLWQITTNFVASNNIYLLSSISGGWEPETVLIVLTWRCQQGFVLPRGSCSSSFQKLPTFLVSCLTSSVVKTINGREVFSHGIALLIESGEWLSCLFIFHFKDSCN